MPGNWADFASRPAVIGSGLCVIAIFIAIVLGLRAYRKNRPTADELERRRRLLIHRAGKIGDGEIVEMEEDRIVYSYSIAGVAYTASQELSALESMLPSGWKSLFGPISIKYDPKNPANSIVLCEDWSGFRAAESRKSG